MARPTRALTYTVVRHMPTRLSVRLAFLALFAAAPGLASAQDRCDRLPASALKERSCSPQEECLRAISAELKGSARANRERECLRLPATGVCLGPDRYDPRAECKDTRRR